MISDRVEMHSRNKLLSVAISRDMSPSAKIVAFYVAPDGQLSADSLQFHVDASGLHKVWHEIYIYCCLLFNIFLLCYLHLAVYNEIGGSYMPR